MWQTASAMSGAPLQEAGAGNENAALPVGARRCSAVAGWIWRLAVLFVPMLFLVAEGAAGVAVVIAAVAVAIVAAVAAKLFGLY